VVSCANTTIPPYRSIAEASGSIAGAVGRPALSSGPGQTNAQAPWRQSAARSSPRPCLSDADRRFWIREHDDVWGFKEFRVVRHRQSLTPHRQSQRNEPNLLSAVERAERNVSIDNIARIAKGLQVEPWRLLKDER
jgi:hypothetical protein